MKIWIDAQLSPAIANWINIEFDYDAVAIRDLGLRDAEDPEIFDSARRAEAVVMTKDRDFLILLDRFGPPPQVIWLTCGNTSNGALRRILRARLIDAMELISDGEPIVEINAR